MVDGPKEAAPTLHVVVHDATPPLVVRTLKSACASQGVIYRGVHAAEVDPRQPPVPAGDLLYAPATSAVAMAVERQLFQPGVATFHADPVRGPYSVVLDQGPLFTRLSLPMPRAVAVTLGDRESLADAAAFVGGFPVILKAGGGEGGVGVMRLSDLDTLTAVAQAMLAHRAVLTVMAFVPDAMHWRVIVVGDAVVTAYRNPLGPDGVRSEPSDDPADYGLTVSEELGELAVAATQANGAEMAGVDVLVHPSGRLYLLEANFPCYFPEAQMKPGSPDVAAAMVDWLLAKAGRVAGLAGNAPNGAALLH